ncbi:hypothetical protein B8V81_2699 [Paenibacillus pasadenensis]|uniref:Uncharacterized protein n=1 Tax=Paenibacillus pasadenensis TaxID=217090 RepID=A0A2N5N1Q2_9BACL|nr:hypothetical protein B8V81_2699 [Paenibacillus pasadenensis]
MKSRAKNRDAFGHSGFLSLPFPKEIRSDRLLMTLPTALSRWPELPFGRSLPPLGLRANDTDKPYSVKYSPR